MDNPLQSKALYKVTKDSTRLMIGLKWEPRQAKAVDNIDAGILTSIGYFFSVILWVPSRIISIFTGDKVDAPSKLSNSALYNAKNIDKVSDDKASREQDYSQYDLDLYCYAYDEKNQFLFVNGPEDENMISDDGVIYSSGEDFTGRGVYDDESAYIDLKKTNNRHANLFIVVVSDCKYDFASLDNQPRVRIVDSKFEKELESFDIPTALSLSKDCYAYIYAKLSQKDGVWNFEPIQRFIRNADDVPSVLESYLKP